MYEQPIPIDLSSGVQLAIQLGSPANSTVTCSIKNQDGSEIESINQTVDAAKTELVFKSPIYNQSIDVYKLQCQISNQTDPTDVKALLSNILVVFGKL